VEGLGGARRSQAPRKQTENWVLRQDRKEPRTGLAPLQTHPLPSSLSRRRADLPYARDSLVAWAPGHPGLVAPCPTPAGARVQDEEEHEAAFV
jgi:hypothetical protein